MTQQQQQQQQQLPSFLYRINKLNLSANKFLRFSGYLEALALLRKVCTNDNGPELTSIDISI
jgi:hypothetical protein